MRIKPLNLFQLISLGICAFGVQFISSLQMANTSSVYKFLGATSSSLPFLWLAAPITGMIMQPLIGQLSDDTSTRFGKRRPYLLGWAIITFTCLCLLPFSTTVLMAALLFWLIGCSLNGCMESMRALAGDIAPNEQKTTAFAWQTILSGIGAAVAALLPWILEHFITAEKIFSYNALPFAVQLSFFLGAFILIACIFWVCWAIQEKVPTHSELLKKQHQQKKINFFRLVYHLFQQIFVSIKKTPPVIRRFVPTQIFTWTGIFIIWLYFSMALAQHVYGLPVGVVVTGNKGFEAILTESTVDTGFYFGIYQFVSVLYAMLLPSLSQKIPSRLLHGISLIIGALSLILFSLVHHWLLISLCMVGVGIMWGSVTVLPVAIVAAEIPRTKMGIYLGIFNITVTLPQIAVGFLLGPITAYLFQGHTIYTIILAGISLMIGGLLMVQQVIPLNFLPGKILKKQWQN